MMSTIIVFLPLILLLTLALTTKRMAESMTAATFLALLILHRENFISGTIDSFYKTLSGSSFQFVLILMVIFGGVIELLQRSGGLMGLGSFVAKYANGKHKPLVMSWVMSLLMFADEYLNAITVSLSMSSITDLNRIPREHLALQVHVSACCVCAMVPFTSWIGFTLGMIEDYGMGFMDYVKSLPYMIYPITIMIICLLLGLGIFPKIGPLKEAYKRIEEGGPAFIQDKSERSVVEATDLSDVEERSLWYALIPILALIIGVVSFDNDLVHGLVIALIVQFVMYIGGRIMTVEEFFGNFFNGAKSLTQLTIILCLGFTLSETSRELGFFDIVINGVTGAVPSFLIPVIAFLVTGMCVFTMGGCWIVMLITIPVFVPMAIAAGVSPGLTVAAVMSGVTMGYGLCIYSDTVFITSMGTGVSNITIIRSAVPYALFTAAISVVWFIVWALI